MARRSRAHGKKGTGSPASVGMRAGADERALRRGAKALAAQADVPKMAKALGKLCGLRVRLDRWQIETYLENERLTAAREALRARTPYRFAGETLIRETPAFKNSPGGHVVIGHLSQFG